MAKNRKYDTLTKNALVDDILKQVRSKRTVGVDDQPDKPVLNNLSTRDWAQQLQAGKDKSHSTGGTAVLERFKTAADKQKTQQPETKTAAPVREPKRGIEPKKAPEALPKQAVDTRTPQKEDTLFIAIPKKVDHEEEEKRLAKVASFFGAEETPDSIVPDEYRDDFDEIKKKRKKGHGIGGFTTAFNKPKTEDTQAEKKPEEVPAKKTEEDSRTEGSSLRRSGGDTTALLEGVRARRAAEKKTAADAVLSGFAPKPAEEVEEPAPRRAKEEPKPPEGEAAPEATPMEEGTPTPPINLYSSGEIDVKTDSRRAGELKDKFDSGTMDDEMDAQQEMEEAYEKAQSIDERELLRRSRESVVQQFSLDKTAIDSAFADEAEESDEILGDEDQYTALEKLISLKGKLKMRMGVTLIASILLVYHNLAMVIGLPLPSFLSPTEGPMLYLALNLVLLLVGVAVCTSTLVNGFLYTFSLRGDNDSLVSLAFFGCIVHTIILFFNPDALTNSTVYLYSSVAMIALFCNCFGKLNMVYRILRNARFIQSDSEKFTVEIIEQENLAEQVLRDVGIREPVICYRKRSTGLNDFVEHSFSEDASDRWAQKVSLISAGVGLIIACMMFIRSGDLTQAVGSMSLFMCILSPFSLMLCFHVPFSRICKSLNRSGGVLAGYSSVEKIYDANSLVLSDSELFPKGTVQLHGMKTFGGERIDEAILKVASVVCLEENALTPVFLKVIQHQTDMLLTYDSMEYQDEMGYSCWLKGRRVLVGNRELMLSHGVDVPSLDYEEKYRKEGERELLYLATSGELTALFVVSYQADERVAGLLASLDRTGVLLSVAVKDPGVTRERIAEAYDLPENMITTVHAQVAHRIEEMVEDVSTPGDCAVVSLGSFLSFGRGILAALHAKSAAMAGLISQTVGIVLGSALFILLTVLLSSAQLTPAVVLIYQFVWLIITLAAPSLRGK